MKCKICGTRINEGEKFCPKCGTEAGTTDVKVENLDENVEKKYCPDCGSLVLGEHRFCVKCGAKLDSFVKEQNIVETEKQETHIIKENSNGNVDSSTSVNTSVVKKYTIKKFSNGFWQCPACGKMNTPERIESCLDCGLKLIDHEVNHSIDWICPDCYQLNNELNKKCWACGKEREEPEEDKSENVELNQIEDSKKQEPVVQIITSNISNNGLEQNDNSELEKKKNLAVAFAWIFGITACVCALIAKNNYSVAEEIKHEKNEIIQKLEEDNERKSSDMISSVESPIHVVVNKIFNSKDGSSILNHSNLAYLNLDFTVYGASKVSKNSELGIKILDSSGKVSLGGPSRNGYTMFVPVNSTWTGWGNDYCTAYQRGWYLIEFYYLGDLVGRKKVWID